MLSARSSSGGGAYTNSSAALLLFGGVAAPLAVGASPLSEDVPWLYSLTRAEWVKLHTPAGGARPSARLGHSAVAVSPGTLWLYGGLADGGSGGGGGGERGGDGDPLGGAGHAGGGGRPVAHEDDTWHFELPSQLDEAVAACAGCSEHGACDLSLRRCICDPPWGGVRCAEEQTAAVPRAPRRAIAASLWLSASLLLGGLLGWVSRGRRIANEEQQRAREEARERRFQQGAGA